jgi:excisionase family DNA binding protein
MIRYLSAADASKLLGVTPGGVRLMVRRGELRVAATTDGGIKLFNHNDVDELVKRRIARRNGADPTGKSAQASSPLEEPSDG